ncbi:MAG: hypothetical protein QXU18_15185, partial [Thermoplasmatales archaeon]
KLEFKNPNLNVSDSYSINTNMDVNILGGMGEFGDDGHGNMFHLGSFFNGFGPNVMNYETVDFSVFSVPLQQWSRVYDSSTNSTTFYYNATSNYSLDESVNVNGNNYSLKLMTDPSAAITTNGQATPTSSNELVVSNAAAPGTAVSSTAILVVIGIIAVAAIGISAVLMRKRAKTQ